MPGAKVIKVPIVEEPSVKVLGRVTREAKRVKKVLNYISTLSHEEIAEITYAHYDEDDRTTNEFMGYRGSEHIQGLEDTFNLVFKSFDIPCIDCEGKLGCCKRDYTLKDDEIVMGLTPVTQGAILVGAAAIKGANWDRSVPTTMKYVNIPAVEHTSNKDYCPYHSLSSGCVLPRTHRPSLCLRYFCSSIEHAIGTGMAYTLDVVAEHFCKTRAKVVTKILKAVKE